MVFGHTELILSLKVVEKYKSTQLPRVRFTAFMIFSEEKIVHDAEVNQQRCLEESGQMLDNLVANG